MKLLILSILFVVWIDCQTTVTLTSSTTTAQEPPVYILVAPSVFRVSQNYTVSMNILRRPPNLDHTDFLVRLMLANRLNDTFAARVIHQRNIELGHAQIVHLSPEVSSFDPSDEFKLMFQIENIDGDVLYAASSELRFDTKALSIFVQTDRAVYRPAALVRYRAILLRSDLKPYNDTATIKIYDPNGNLISQVIDANLTKGVYSGRLQLADECLLGDWKITVDAKRNGQQEALFTVDQYILPKFDVQIKTPPFITVNQNLSVLVSAKYTYGKGVSGKAKVSLQLPWHQWHMIETDSTKNGGHDDKTDMVLERTLKLNRAGEATFDFYNSELKKHNLLQEYFSSIRIIASVTEDITEIERNASHTISTYRDEVKLVTEKQQGDTFKPGLQYTVAIALRQMDDTPLEATLPKRVQVTTFYNYPYNPDASSSSQASREEKETRIVEVDAHATTSLTLNPPINCSSARIEALYDITGRDNFTNTPIFTSLYVDAAVSPTNTFLQLIADKGGPVEVGRTLSFTLKCTKQLAAFNYQVMSRSKIVAAAQHVATTTTTTITFTATPEMAPKSRLVVYAILGDDSRGEVLVDALDFEVDGVYQNEVQMTIDKQSVEPGEMVNVKVSADKDSFVGLLVVDQSVLLLKSGNDLTREKVELDLEAFDSIIGGSGGRRNWEMMDRRKKRSVWRPWWGIGGNDAQSIFSNAGLIVLTDALVYREEQPIALRTPGGVLGDHVMLEAAAMPAAGTFASSAAPPPAIRRFFPHTWIWEDADAGAIDVQLAAPDTMTTWIATAFAVSAESGLGIAAQPAKLRTFRPFFIQLNLPYSVRRGEKFALLVQLFNYMEKEQDVTVTLVYGDEEQPTGGFDLLRKDGTVVKRDELNQENVRIVSVAGSGTTKPVYFPIVPSTIGEINITVFATAGGASDAISMPLRVDPQGYKVSRNIPFIIEAGAGNTNSSTVVLAKTIEWPNDLVDGSEKVHVEMIGDLMGPLMDRVGDLVEMPYGCGEQNMLNLVPNILVLKYLEETKRTKPELEAKAKRFIEAGVQRELTFRHDSDKSFSAFGNADARGSTWLTAFVIRAFNHATPYTFIDTKIIHDAISWLNREQLESGAYPEHGEVHHKDMQGGAQDGGNTLTAYVLISLLENGVKNVKAVRFLEKHVGEAATDPYALSVICYALKLADSDKFDEAWQLFSKFRREEKSGAVRYGSSKNGPTRPIDIETTSYALLTLLETAETWDEAANLVRYLISQRNALGGFASTQDTVIALQALARYGTLTYTAPNATTTLTITNGAKSPAINVSIAPENATILQSVAIANVRDAIHIATESSNGAGVIFGQLVYTYYREVSVGESTPFYCVQETKELRAGNRLQLDLCCNYTRAGKSNMALAEIDSLTGYRFDAEQVNTLKSIEDLQRIEIKNDDTKMNVYFNPLGSKPVCLSLYSDVTYQVADQKPANFRLIDYYEPEDQLKLTYSPKQTRSLAEKCAEDCWPPANSPQMPQNDDGDVSSAAAGSQVCLISAVIVLLMIIF